MTTKYEPSLRLRFPFLKALLQLVPAREHMLCVIRRSLYIEYHIKPDYRWVWGTRMVSSAQTSMDQCLVLFTSSLVRESNFATSTPYLISTPSQENCNYLIVLQH